MKAYLILLSVCVLNWANAQGNYRTTQFTVTVKGTSNLHEWETSTKEARASGAATVDASGLKSIQTITVEVPVKTLKSTKGSIMDGKTYDALKAKNYPTITFKLDKITSLNKKGDGYDINATGYLSIAGVTNKIDIYVKGKVGADGTLSFTGSKKMKMTDYKIDPPKALFGTLTTGDDIEVVFQLTLKQF